MADRPYINHSIEKLYELYNEHIDELPVLEKLHIELGFRKKNRNAPSFRAEVKLAIEAKNRGVVLSQQDEVSLIVKAKPAKVVEAKREISTNTINRDCISFSLTQVPVNLRRVVMRTAHIHEYQIKHLKPELYRNIDKIDQIKIAKVMRKLSGKQDTQILDGGHKSQQENESGLIPFFVKSSNITVRPLLSKNKVISERKNEQGSSSLKRITVAPTQYERDIAQAIKSNCNEVLVAPRKVSVSVIDGKTRLKDINVPHHLERARETIIRYKSSITLEELKKITPAKLRAASCWDMAHAHLTALREHCKKLVQNKIISAPNPSKNISTEVHLRREKALQQGTQLDQVKSEPNGFTLPDGVSAKNLLLRDVSVSRELKFIQALVINNYKDITLEALNCLRLLPQGLSPDELDKLKYFFFKDKATKSKSLLPSISQHKTPTDSINSNTAVTGISLLNELNVPKKFISPKAALLAYRNDITLAELNRLKSSELMASGCWTKMSYTLLATFRNYCNQEIKRSAKSAMTVIPKNASKLESETDVAEQAITTATKLSSLKLPKELIHTYSKIIMIRPSITIRDLRVLKNKRLDIKYDDFVALKDHCIKLLNFDSKINDSSNTKSKSTIYNKKIKIFDEEVVRNKQQTIDNVSLSSLLTEINLPEELRAILKKADLYLPFRATVKDLLDKNDYPLGTVAADDVAALKCFINTKLQQLDSCSVKNVIVTQDDFYDVPVTSSAILDAPPGCGKTHSIVGRLTAHVAGLKTSYEAKDILVLSFTKNAVNEIKQRLEQHAKKTGNSKLYYVQVMTFDALAYRTLERVGGKSPTGDFDANITRLKSLLITGEVDGEGNLASLRWLYVDEYQDLVGCRADLVLELVKKILLRKGAAYMLGDPCQQIMNFQMKTSTDIDNRTFIRKFKELTRKKCVELELSKSYRFRTDEQKKRVQQLRGSLQDNGIQTIHSSDFAPRRHSLAGIESGTAILCPRNIDTYLVADRLIEIGIECHVNTGSGRHTAPRWLYDSFWGWEDDTMSIGLFEEKCRAWLGSDGKYELEYLRTMRVVEGKSINVRLLVDKLENNGGLPESPNNSAVVISTIHKAKGLQYKNVLLLCDENESFEHGSNELFAFYVAVTRAQEQFELLTLDNKQRIRSGKSKIYRGKDCVYLEGLSEIKLSSILQDELELTKEELDYLGKEKASYKIVSDDGNVYLVAQLYGGKELKLYRLPRLEHFSYYHKDQILLFENIRPTEYSTFIYMGENPAIEQLLGPTCMIALPVFTGLWKYKYV